MNQTFPASSQQAGLWFIHQAEPGCGAYHLLFTAEVTPSAKLAQRAADAVPELIELNDALRVSFEGTGTEILQRVHPQVQADIRIAEGTRDLDDASLRERVRQDSREPFDLTRPPLWRVHLYPRAQTWVVAVVAHHIVLDFWSLALILAALRDRLDGREPTRALDGSAFGEHAVAQRSRLADAAVTEGWGSRWRERLAGVPGLIDLPSDRPRPATPSYQGASVPFTVPARTSEKVRQLARDSSSSPFMTVLAAYQLMLARLSGQPKVAVATPTSGRLDRRSRDAIGSYVSTLVVPGAVDEEQTYRELLESTRDQVIDCLRDQEAPLPWLVGRLAPPRDPSHSPLAQVGLAWDRLPFLPELGDFFLLEPGESELEVAGARLRPFPVPQQEGQLDLWIEMGGERDGCYVGVLRYNTDLFDHATAQDLTAAFVTALSTGVQNPDVPMRELDTLSPKQADRLRAWGRGPEPELPATTVPALINQEAHRRPTSIAVADTEGTWTYAELATSVAVMAGKLRAAGVGPGDRVGVMLERDRSLVAALLAVLQAGAAYVPLDPSFPRERLDYMASDAQIRLLISDDSLREFWPSEVRSVLHTQDLPEPMADLLPESLATPDGLAYILYTSGSTGRPKGVAIGHAALLNLLVSMAERMGFGVEDSLLAVTTISFDIAGLELFLPLISGGRLLVCDSATTHDGSDLAAELERTSPTWMQATPSSWQMLRDADWKPADSLNILCGGEPLPEDLADFLSGSARSLTNVYGPTETTIWSTAGAVVPSQGVDLGTPLDHTQLYVTDNYGRSVPPGMYGELQIGGTGLAQGYWERPDLTAERFRQGLPCAPDERVYRTGDRVRWSATGRLTHHGRLDSQVKVRGYRIELAEVEAVLAADPQVAVAVVVVRNDRLVGYVVPKDTSDPDTTALLATATQKLPPYMVPHALVVLNELPMTANQKVDRAALPAPVPAGNTEFTQPRDAVEITLARMWAELLQVPRVGIKDDFFDLGGHSLLAVRLGTMVEKEWGQRLKVADVLRYSTIEALAAHLRTHSDSGARSPLITLSQGQEGQRPLFLMHPFGGTVYCYVETARRLPESTPVLAIEAPGLEIEDAAEVTVESMAAKYLELVREAQPEGPYALGGWCFGGVVAFEAARRLRAEGHEVDLLVAVDTRAPIEQNVPESADDVTLLSWFARDLAVPYGKTLDVPAEELRGLSADEAFDLVLERAAQIGVLAPDADREQLLRYFEVYLGNGLALQMYQPEPEDSALLLLTARDEPVDYGPALGWDHLLGKGLEVLEVSGDHNSVMYSPHAAEVAAIVGERLNVRQ